MQAPELKEILEKYQAGNCSAEEKARLESWYLAYNEGQQVNIPQAIVEVLQKEMWQAIDQPVIRKMNKRWHIAAAASIILICTSIWLWSESGRRHIPEQHVAFREVEVLPGTDRAVLTLANGSEIRLDSAGVKEIKQSGPTVFQKGNVLQYAAGNKQESVSYNTLTTPRGGRFQLIMQDGTRVWLNAASSIRYPTAFIGSRRVVEVTGEVYFEVAQDKTLPFTVKLGNNNEVQVLGTSFNINSYSDEESINTTLLEGSVNVNAGENKALLKPGEQSQANSAGIFLVKQADIASVMAWKNGLFNFNGKNLAQVMRQLERWYDVDVSYESRIPNVRFFGEMDQSLSLNNVLRILEKSNVHFRIEKGKRLVVLP